MACEQNAVDSAAIVTSLPGANELVWFTDALTGLTVFRRWSTMLQSLGATDIEFQIGVTGGAPVAGAFTYTNAALIGKRIRLFRDELKQHTIGDSTMRKYSFDDTTGLITVNVAWADLERVSIEQY
jgi:hypothetical protein